jgi:hypothetical protein
MLSMENIYGIDEHDGSRWDLREQAAVRPAELQLAIWISIELKAFFVDCAVVPATEQSKIRKFGGAAVSPVMDVVALPEAYATAREGAAAVAMVERST